MVSAGNVGPRMDSDGYGMSYRFFQIASIKRKNGIGWCFSIASAYHSADRFCDICLPSLSFIYFPFEVARPMSSRWRIMLFGDVSPFFLNPPYWLNLEIGAQLGIDLNYFSAYLAAGNALGNSDFIGPYLETRIELGGWFNGTYLNPSSFKDRERRNILLKVTSLVYVITSGVITTLWYGSMVW